MSVVILVKNQYTSMECGTLLECRPQGAVQAVLQIELALPLNDMSEEVTVEGGLLGQQGREVEVALGGDELIEPDHARWHVSPVTSVLQPVCGIGTSVAHESEDHSVSLGTPDPPL